MLDLLRLLGERRQNGVQKAVPDYARVCHQYPSGWGSTSIIHDLWEKWTVWSLTKDVEGVLLRQLQDIVVTLCFFYSRLLTRTKTNFRWILLRGQDYFNRPHASDLDIRCISSDCCFWPVLFGNARMSGDTSAPLNEFMNCKSSILRSKYWWLTFFKTWI